MAQFSGDERGGWYRFLYEFCSRQGVEHHGQAEHDECEQAAFAAWDALTEPQREAYREQYRATAAPFLIVKER